MKLRKIFTLGVATAAIVGLSHLAVAQDSQTGSQSSGEPATHGIAGQSGSDDTTLEIAPQPGLAAPKASVRELPTDRNFNPGEDTSSVDPNFRPGTENGTGDIDSNLNGNGNSESGRPHARPYLGITVQYTTMCYLGGEEQGLEVLTIDPNSPASQAGLQARSGLTAVGAALTTLSGILPGGSILATKALGSTGAEGQGGDLIVAIDDKRVRDQSDLQSAMSRLKPGDTMYLTVIRPQGSGDRVPHTTIKIAVRVGAVGEPIANAAPAGGDSFTH
ncbi:MAG TPA: PDZ domain-containing protein [Verrucomicrobiae bacterium]|nr:PDZ domain-containing protein [Verrucomicrobiae bacterium]